MTFKFGSFELVLRRKPKRKYRPDDIVNIKLTWGQLKKKIDGVLSNCYNDKTGNLSKMLMGIFKVNGIPDDMMEPELFALLTPKHKLVSMEELNYQPIKLQHIVEDL
jgi:hypothetical protein